MTQLTPEWLAKFQSFLGQRISMSVATTSPTGSPRVADVYFVSDADLNLCFYSDPALRHSRNIQRDPLVHRCRGEPQDAPHHSQAYPLD